jgi:hypothetical protein
MTNKKFVVAAACTSLGSLGVLAADGVAWGQVVGTGGTHIDLSSIGVVSEDKTIDADTCVIPAGAVIRVSNGAQLTLNCGILNVQGPASFDGRGAPGQNGRNGSNNDSRWTSTKRCWNNQGHEDWEHAGGVAGDRGENGGAGTDGGPGSVVSINYQTVSGVYGGLGNIRFDMTGGYAGYGGRGGAGRFLKCGCHGEERRGPSGNSGGNGSPGQNGHYDLSPNLMKAPPGAAP